jgi:signal transduction histidine kinase
LTNVVKHASASRVAITLVHDDETLDITIADDGVGLDAGAATDGFGLIGMRERISLAGGTLTISPGRVSGTTIAVRLPVGAGGVSRAAG